MSKDSAQSTKESSAKKGVISGALLTVIELSGGIISGSLGLISSALNTIMDLVASVIAFFAVRVSGKPPDESHTYGHQKVEAFAAIGEVGLLIIVCVWLVYNAIIRLVSGSASISYLWIALGTNFASIAIDMYAYVELRSVSRKQGSEALSAGALHFLNDLLIAIVVIMGLIFYGFGIWYADSVAALCVVVVTLYTSLGVIKRSVGMLMDTAPSGAVGQLRSRILSVKGVEDCHSLRVRQVGLKYFVDAHVEIEEDLPLSQAHSIADNIELKINKVFPDSDVIIHTEPHLGIDATTKVRSNASEFSEIRDVHDVRVYNIGDKHLISYHLEMEANTNLEKAHEIANQLESLLKKTFGETTIIVSHLEPTANLVKRDRTTLEEISTLRIKVIQVAEETPGIRSTQDIRSLKMGGKMCITLNCTVDSNLTLDQAHNVATTLEERIKAIDPRIDYVIIHCEPVNQIS